MQSEADRLIRQLGLKAHPEGGWYAETYRASLKTETARGARNLVTLIYYLLPKGVVSRLHRVAWDEIWIYQAGGVLSLMSDGAAGQQVEKLGVTEHSSPQVVIPAGTWFNAEVSRGEFVLAACMVAPGFEFDDLEMK